MVWLPPNVHVNVQPLIADEPVLLIVTFAPKPVPQSLDLVYVTEQMPLPEDVAVGGTDVFVRVAVGPMGVFVFVAVGPTGVLVFVAVGGTEVLVEVAGTGVLVDGEPPGSLPQTREPLTYAGMLLQSA